MTHTPLSRLTRFLVAALLVVVTPTVAWAQLGSVPYSFSSGTVIASAQVNTNFSTIYSNALNRTGGTMTGTLTLSGTAANIILGSNYVSGDGDDEGISIDGSGVVTISSLSLTTLTCTGCVGATQLASTAVSAASYGGANSIATFTVDADGRLTAAAGVTPQIPISTGVTGLGTGVATWLTTPSSANLAAVVTDETGSGAAVFATSPTLVTPTLGVATATTLDTGQGANELYDMDQNVLQISDVIFGSVSVDNVGLRVEDTGGDHFLSIRPGTNLTANRDLTIVTGDAARQITLNGDPVLNDWFDQNVKAAASPTFASVELNATDTTLSRVSAGVMAVEGNTVAMLATAQTFTAKQTISFANGTDFTAEIAPTTSGTPYGLNIKEPATPGSGYPLLAVSNNAGSRNYFRVDSSTGKAIFDGPVEIVNASGTNELVFTGTTTTNLFSATTDTFQLGTTAAGAFELITNNTARMSVTSGGLFGFGRSNAGLTFHEFRESLSVHSAGGAAVYLYGGSGSTQMFVFRELGTYVDIGSVQNIYLGFKTNSVENLRLTADGHVAINAAKRHYWDGVAATGNTYTYEESADTLVDMVGGTKTFERTAGAIKVLGAEAGAATFRLWADEGDDSTDKWSFSAADGGTLTLERGDSVPKQVFSSTANEYYLSESGVQYLAASLNYYSAGVETRLDIYGGETVGATIRLIADQGDNAADTWTITNPDLGSNTLSFTNGSAGTVMSMWTTGVVRIPSLASSSGTRYVCSDTNGDLTDSASACSGTDAAAISLIPMLQQEIASLRAELEVLRQHFR